MLGNTPSRKFSLKVQRRVTSAVIRSEDYDQPKYLSHSGGFGVLVPVSPLFLLPGRREAGKTTNTTGQEGSPRARSRSSRAAGSYAGERASLYVSNYAPVLRPVCGARKATLKATIMSLLGGEGAERSTKEWFVWL